MLESRVSNAVQVQWKLPQRLTVLPTYKCTAACHECCFQSNPRITKRVPQDRLREYIDQAAEIDTIRLVCFSGGEAFVLGNDLVELVARSSSHGFMTRIVSNGYWATSEKAARKRLSPLIESGLNEINFSTGDDHAEWVPVERVLCGLATGLSFGLGMALMIEERAARRVTRDTVLEQAKAFPALLTALENGVIPILESPWMPFAPDGRPLEAAKHRLANRDNVYMREPCTSVMTTVVVTPDERLGMCCGLPREKIPDLHAGSLRDARMKALVDRSANDFLKIWLFVEGPERILAWAASKDPSIDWELTHVQTRDACQLI